MEACNACEGNVSHGKTCHRCGRKGPLGQGWHMRAIDLEVEASTLRARVAELEAQLAAPLRLGRGPTKEEFRKHGAAGGGWMLQGVGEDSAGWAMEMRQIPEADLDAMVRFTRDAIPLNAARQPCRVGEGT